MYSDVYALNVNKNFALLVNGILNLMGMVGDIMVKTDLVIRSGVWSEGLKPIEGDILGTIISDILKWLLSDGVNAHYVRSLGAVLSLAAPYFWGYSYSSFLIFLRDPEPKCGAEDRDIVFERWVLKRSEVLISILLHFFSGTRQYCPSRICWPRGSEAPQCSCCSRSGGETWRGPCTASSTAGRGTG